MTVERKQDAELTGTLAIRVQRFVRRLRRNRLAREIKKDKRYFQPLGWWKSNRLTWQIKLLLSKPEK